MASYSKKEETVAGMRARRDGVVVIANYRPTHRKFRLEMLEEVYRLCASLADLLDGHAQQTNGPLDDPEARVPQHLADVHDGRDAQADNAPGHVPIDLWRTEYTHVEA